MEAQTKGAGGPRDGWMDELCTKAADQENNAGNFSLLDKEKEV